MAWYWWVLIVVGVALIVYLKVLFVPRFMKKMAEKRAETQRKEEED